VALVRGYGSNYLFKPTAEITASFFRRAPRGGGLTRRWAWLSLTSDFVKIVDALAKDNPLPEKYSDHALTLDWKDHQDCHVKPNLVLIYRKPDDGKHVDIQKNSEKGRLEDRTQFPAGSTQNGCLAARPEWE